MSSHHSPGRTGQSREREMLSEIGISHFEPGRFRGFLGLHPFDTFIEEIQFDHSIISVSPYEEEKGKTKETGAYLYADLVSSKMTRRDLEDVISKDLKISKRDIYFFSEKKAFSIFSQKIALKGVTKKQLEKIKTKGYFLKNLTKGKKPDRKSRPFGDRYTVLIRTDKQVDEDALLTHIARIESRGFYNFYHFSRFDKRLIAHKVGAHILRGNYQEAINEILFSETRYEMKAASEKRYKAAKLLPKYGKVLNFFKEENDFFKLEIKILIYLKKNPSDFIGALKNVSQYTRQSLRAFSVYLFNRYLSTKILEKKKLKQDIPLFPTTEKDTNYFYGNQLTELNIPSNYKDNLKPLKELFDYTRKSFRPTRINTEIRNTTIIPDGVILTFNLPRETHVKTLLNNFFVLMSKGKTPQWVSAEKYDILQTLGLGSAVGIIKKFK